MGAAVSICSKEFKDESRTVKGRGVHKSGKTTVRDRTKDLRGSGQIRNPEMRRKEMGLEVPCLELDAQCLEWVVPCPICTCRWSRTSMRSNTAQGKRTFGHIAAAGVGHECICKGTPFPH